MSKSLDIVLIEDNPADVLLMQETLKESDIECSMKVLEDGEEAIDYFYSIAEKPELKPDLIVLDLNLPKKDGHLVLTTLRKLPSLNKLSVVVLTTSENPEDERKVLAQNAYYLVKPANVGNLSRILEAAEASYREPSMQQASRDIAQARFILDTKKISRMLLVEDNQHDALFVQELLKDSSMADCDLKTAEDLTSAIEALATLPIDIILADLTLPDAQGLETLTSLLKAAHGIPLIVLTGVEDEALAEQAVVHGAQDYLVKGQIDSRSLAKSVRYSVTRKKAEELALLRVANENGVLKEILENAPIGMARFTPDLRISACNSSFSRQLTLDTASVIGRLITDLVSISDSSLWQKVISENSSFRAECILKIGETPESTWDMTVWPVQQQDEPLKKSTKGGIILALDITERLKLERQQEDFIASLAHDIRNPLIGSDRALTIMAEQNLAKHEQTRMFKALKQSNANVLAMMQNMLDIYKYEAAVVKLDFQPILLIDPIEAAIANARLIAAESKVKISLKFAENLQPISADKTAMQKLFNNLLHNAIKFSKEGETIDLRAYEENDSVVVLLANKEMSISENQLELLFKRFGESRSSKYVSGAGTGLGLYLCKQIVDAHQGKISCTSQTSEGTTFEVRFPLNAAIALGGAESCQYH